MDDKERNRKLEAGKVKLAHFRKKKHYQKKKQDSPHSTPREPSNSEDIDACNSTAVQTGDDSSLRALTPSDDSERSTTTAEDISTEEEAACSLQLSSVERIQELELTVSDQQAALQKLTLENKSLREKNEAALSDNSFLERDSMIKELRDSVLQSAQHVRSLQQQLSLTTSAVIETGGEQSQVVAELADTRQKLDTYQMAMIRQEEALQQMTQTLNKKKEETVEASERILSLQAELNKNQSEMTSLEQHTSEMIRVMREEFELEKDNLKVELEARHQEELSTMKNQHKIAVDEEIRKQRLMEQQHTTTYDPEDARAFREQAELLRSQLETTYRDLDKLKRDHDKEVIELSQQLVNNADEYESKLQTERTRSEDLERRLEMSDTVSSEIQSSFSKQLEQLEEERNVLRQQLRQAQHLEEELLTYQSELADVSSRLEETEKQKRHYRDEMERSQEANDKLKQEKSLLEINNEDFNGKLIEQTNVSNSLKEKILEMNEENDRIVREHKLEVEKLMNKESEVKEAAREDLEKTEQKMKEMSSEHSEELKHLHSQHHRQMEELKKDMEKELEATKCELDEARKEQLESVKDVHERSRDREFARLKESHDEAVHQLKENHAKEVEAVKREAEEVRMFAEERLRIELKKEYDADLEKELSILRRSLEQEFDLIHAETLDSHREEMENMKMKHKEEMEENLSKALEEQGMSHQVEIEEQKKSMKTQLDEALAKMEAEMEASQNGATDRVSDLTESVTRLKGELRDADEQNDNMKQTLRLLENRLEEQMQELEENHRTQLEDCTAAHSAEKKLQEEKIHECTIAIKELKEELEEIQTERDQIFSQAEESQKRLAALHHEESLRMQEELDQMEANYQEKVEQMQYEIESLRASRNDLQDLRSQLQVRNASVEEITLLKEEFALEKGRLMEAVEEEKSMKEKMVLDHKEEIEKLREAHQLEMHNKEEKTLQLVRQLEEEKEKLSEIGSSVLPLGSSPIRPPSQMSEYDPTNIEALNKDYRSAMTLTHVSGVSGLSETLDVEQPDDEIGDEVASSNLREEIATLSNRIEEMKNEIERLKEDHSLEISKLVQEKEEKIGELNSLHIQELTKANEEHHLTVENLKGSHQKEITQVHLQCASDTAKQVEDETSSLSHQLEVEYGEKMDALKQQLEREHNEKLEIEQNKHEEEIAEKSKELSSSLEIRISALMEELHEQKQQALQNASLEHEDQLRELREDFNEKMKDAVQKQAELSLTWKQREETLEEAMEDLKRRLAVSQDEYRNLLDGLDSGDSDYLRVVEEKNAAQLEELKRQLEVNFEERKEEALKEQADAMEEAQEEFMKLHREQMDKFTADQKRDEERKELEIAAKVEEVGRLVSQKYEEEKMAMVSTHDEEMKAVGLKLVAVESEKLDLVQIKEELQSRMKALQQEKEDELNDMKASLVNQHLMKFQEVTVNLDQLHKEEVESITKKHQEKISALNEDIDSLQMKVDALESSLHKEEKMKLDMISSEALEERLKELRGSHEEEVKGLQEAYDLQLQQIEEEIQQQSSEHKENMQSVLAAQSSDLAAVQRQLDDALKSATDATLAETRKLNERTMELEEQVEKSGELQKELDVVSKRKEELEAMVDEWKLKMQAWDAERDEEKDLNERRTSELTEQMDNLREEYKDLNSRIEFERAEYEAELESLQEELRIKEENVKELEAEIEHKNAALESVVRQQEVVLDRRERECQESNNLLNMLREDLERTSKERENTASCNEQLLSVLSDLVRANQQCENVITRRLERLTISTDEEQQQDNSAQGAESDSTASPVSTSLTGSFVDEGLDLSQRLSESLFTGPELDSSAREMVTSAGVRVGQASERLLDMLEDAINKFNASQRAQTALGDELQRVVSSKQAHQEDQTKLIEDLKEQVASLKGARDVGHERSLEEEHPGSEISPPEEQILALKREQSALAEELAQTKEEMSNEKEMLIEQHQQERTRLVEVAHQLEVAVEEVARSKQEKEGEYLAQIEDLHSQELTNERQAERDEFDKELEKMRIEIEQVRNSSRSEALLAEKLANMEEELNTRQEYEEEANAEITKLKEALQEKENLITDLQEHVNAHKISDESTEDADLQVQLEESRRQEQVLQKELCENMLRTSALEAQLDRYRHGVDESALHSLERSEAEERRMKEQALQALEDKDQEIEVLVDQQNQMRSQVIEKEEEVGKLLQEMEDIVEIRAENDKLKEELQLLSAESLPSHVDHLGALSQHLLDEKNAEIDDLRRHMSLLQSDDKDAHYQQIVADLQTQIDELSARNDDLIQEVKILEERMNKETTDLPKDAPDDEDTGIQDLSITHLVKSDAAETPDAEPPIDPDLEGLEEENCLLREELEKVRARAEELLQQAEEDIFKLPSSMKEKIRDIEEQLIKEKDDVEIASSPREKAANYKEKLLEIEDELRSSSSGVLCAILRMKSNALDEKERLVEQLSHQLTEKIDELEKVKNEIPTLNTSSASSSDGDASQGENESVQNDTNTPLGDDTSSVESSKSSECSEEEIAQLKMLLSEKEDAILKLEETVARKQETLLLRDEELKRAMEDVEDATIKKEEALIQLEDKRSELEELVSENSETSPREVDGLQEQVKVLQAKLDDTSSALDALQKDHDRVSRMLEDVQRECASLLDDNRKLEDVRQTLEEELQRKTMKINELEDGVATTAVLTTSEVDSLKEKIEEANEEIKEMETKLQQANEENENLKVKYDRPPVAPQLAPASGRPFGGIDAGGDSTTLTCAGGDSALFIHAGGDSTTPVRPVRNSATPIHAGGDCTPHKDEEQSAKMMKLSHENDALKEEIDTLLFKIEELQIELDTLKQSHVDCDSSSPPIGDEVSKLQQLYESTKVEDSAPNWPEQRIPSCGSHSSEEDVHEQVEELKKDHQRRMDEIKSKFALELEEAVAKATEEQEERSKRKMTALEEKHRQEISELLSESLTGDGELAQRLRNELDLADKLDTELMNQLKSVTQPADQPITSECDSVSSASPEKEAEISSRLQHLLSRLHNEGVQVLSLSELQFIKQHQPQRNISMNTDHCNESSVPPPVDVDGLRRAWENEKLALMDAIQSLKDLLTQTTAEAARMEEDDEESIRWRGELLRTIADLFEREKRALVAELQACVIDAQREAELNDDRVATSRLESIERKIRTQELQHRGELERLLAADRDQLAEDIKRLKVERQEKLEQADKRIARLLDQHKVAEASSRSTAHQLQNEIEVLSSKLSQEEALTSDLRSSLKLEKQRSCDLISSLDRERNRTVELSTEIAALSESSRKESNDLRAENEKMRCKISTLSRSLEEVSLKMKNLEEESSAKECQLEEMKSCQGDARARDYDLIQELKDSLQWEEDRRKEAQSALDVEKGNVTALQEELALENGRLCHEVAQWKTRCKDLSTAVKAERQKSEELHSALERETILVRDVRLELERERKMSSGARDHERATVKDLQSILEDAKKETEIVQRRAELAEQEREEAIIRAEKERTVLDRKIADERNLRERAVSREKKTCQALQSALDAEKSSKRNLLSQIQRLQDERPQVQGSSHFSQEALLTARRQLESLRQRLQLEASKLQDLVNRTSMKLSPRTLNPLPLGSSRLTSDGECLESLKRSLSDMHGELKELHTQLSLPSKAANASSPTRFNDSLLERNAELSQFAADATQKERALRDALHALQEEKSVQPSQNNIGSQQTADNQQRMANRLHKLYTRYLRAESFRKSLVYQKKYLLLLLGGFQDCEEATLALIARMGAYPSDDALRRVPTSRSPAFTKFRSAARVVVAVCRLKFLVRKWKRANDTVSAAIQNKHGIPVATTSNNAIGAGLNQPLRLAPSATSSPSTHLSDSSNPLYLSAEHRTAVTSSSSPYHRYSNDPPSRETSPFTSGSHLRASSSPSASYDFPRSTERSYTPITGEYKGRSPVAAPAYSSLGRSAADTDPSLNDYIQKLENIQLKLRYPR